ncbi:MAG: alpha/beta fold hydrolase [Salegentibacter sp.]
MKKIILITILIALSVSNSYSQDLAGVWHGTAKTPDNKEVLFVFLFEKDNGAFTTTMAVPTFDVSDIKLEETSFNDQQLVIDDPAKKVRYEGAWNEETKEITGKYQEGSVTLSLSLIKGNPKFAGLVRPQEPKKPYPYFEEEVVFENAKDNIHLAGTFTKPNGEGKFPVVVLISGSGRHDRDGSIPTHKPFLVLSDYLTRQGIAVLRFDDRGFGKSGGDFSKATTADFAQDVLSAVQYLKSRQDIAPDHIGLIGHSEGGIIAPLAANQSADISFIVTLAATGIPGSEVTVLQSKSLRSFPVPDEELFEENVRKSISIATSNAELSEKRRALKAHNEQYLVPILKSLGAPDENISNFIQKETENALSPWSQYFLKYDPAIEFRKLNIPVLSLNGSKDIQVDAKVNQTAIRNALQEGNNKNFKVITLENLNHLFQECETGDMAEYENISQTISPIALKAISEWIIENINS